MGAKVTGRIFQQPGGWSTLFNLIVPTSLSLRFASLCELPIINFRGTPTESALDSIDRQLHAFIDLALYLCRRKSLSHRNRLGKSTDKANGRGGSSLRSWKIGKKFNPGTARNTTPSSALFHHCAAIHSGFCSQSPDCGSAGHVV